MHMHKNTTQQYPDIPVHKQRTISGHTPDTEHNKINNNMHTERTQYAAHRTEHTREHRNRTHSTEQTENNAQPQHRTTHLYAQLFTYIVLILLLKIIYQKTL